MLASDIISKSIPPIKYSDDGHKAMLWMNEFHVLHLPIVNEGKFVGLLSEEDLLNFGDLDQPISSYKLSLINPFVNEKEHFFDVLKTSVELNITLIPVVDLDQNYIGVVSQGDLLSTFASYSGIMESGGIIVLEMSTKDYLLSEVTRIIEAEGVKLLSTTTRIDNSSGLCELTLKLDTQQISKVIASLERFDYKIKASFLESDYLDTLKERYNGLINYLNV